MLKKIRLGDLLLKNNVLKPDEVMQALDRQKATGMRFGNTLIEMGLIDETKLLYFLAEQLNIPFVDLTHYDINPEVIKLVPETLARRYRALPIAKMQGSTLVAMVDPTDVIAFDEISKRLTGPIELAVVREKSLLAVIDQVFRRTDEIASIAHELKEEMGDVNVIEAQEASEDAPILKLLNSIFEDAVQVGASDIHIEPDKDLIRIRFRVDGMLQEQTIKGQSILTALILRLKLMAKLNISERRLPQDGRFTIKVKGKKIDVRLATMPVEGGETAVMRLFDSSQQVLAFRKLGMSSQLESAFEHLLKQAHGMILVTGPTGSGKSTTLYAALDKVNHPDKKIITIEDPIEFEFERINQVQVHPHIGLSFSKILRTALRHDPDVIMVGEIRDEETATIAFRAAMTGHLVLSTLHTSSAIATPGRLIEMGVPGYMVASALRMVIAQRLLRKLCNNCQVPYTPTQAETAMIDKLMGSKTSGIQFLQGKGCSQCQMSGYKGRIGVYEVLRLEGDMLKALREHDMATYEQLARKSPLYRTLTHWALDYACLGVTSIQEVLHLVHDIEDEKI